jgi:twitching motility protein PilT
MDDIRLGAILLEGGVVDAAGLERCLAIQALTGGTRPIGQILIEQGLLDESTRDRLLQLQRDRIELQQARQAPADLGSATLLQAARSNRASELVVSEGRPARIRVGASWQQLTADILRGPKVWEFVRETMGSEVLESLAEHHFVVRPWAIEGLGRGSATAFRQFDGVAVRMTLAPAAVSDGSAVAAALPPAVVDATRAGRGLVLLVGERGLGRAEAMAALLRVVASDAGHYVAVVDDEPIDVPEGGALVVRRRYGIGPDERAASLRSVIAEDPDALLIADIGSAATFEIALRAAEGGRLVVAYLDAANATGALLRGLNFYPVHDLPRVRSTLAAVLRCVLVRQLLPDSANAGTVAATEVLLVDDAVREVVRGGDLGDLSLLLRADGGRHGHSLDRAMLDLLTSGQVRLEDVFSRAEEKAWLLERTRDLQTAR